MQSLYDPHTALYYLLSFIFYLLFPAHTCRRFNASYLLPAASIFSASSVRYIHRSIFSSSCCFSASCSLTSSLSFTELVALAAISVSSAPMRSSSAAMSSSMVLNSCCSLKLNLSFLSWLLPEFAPSEPLSPRLHSLPQGSGFSFSRPRLPFPLPALSLAEAEALELPEV